MKIAHVVTYISSDGAFGGPSRVALGQAEQLAREGHEVEIFAASPVAKATSSDVDGYRLHQFPARHVSARLGFAGMYAPGLSRALRKRLPALDAVHVHLARDLVTLPASRTARLRGSRLILQPHGMIDGSDKALAALVDAWEVRRSLDYASAVLTLTGREKAEILKIAPSARIVPIANGLRAGQIPPLEGRSGDVLFLARLHPRKRPEVFVRMAAKLIEQGFRTTNFVLAGPDEGAGKDVEREIQMLGVGDNVRWVGAVDPSRTDEMLRDARVYVLPSVGEVFPMSVLEAFRAGTPTVVTDSLGIAHDCVRYGAASVTDGSVEGLATAVAQLLADPQASIRLRAGAEKMLGAELGIESVVRTLTSNYAPTTRVPRGTSEADGHIS